MPEITRFLGSVVKMYFRQSEHNPPHFHVIYNEYAGEFSIETLEMLEGDIPPRIQGYIKEWGSLYKEQLMRMWNEKRVIKLPPLV